MQRTLWQAKERRDKNKAKAEESPEPTPGEQAAAAVSTITGKVPRPPEHQHKVATEHLEEAAKVRAKITKESIEQARKAVEQDKKRRPYVITYYEDARGPFYVPEWSGSQIVDQDQQVALLLRHALRRRVAVARGSALEGG